MRRAPWPAAPAEGQAFSCVTASGITSAALHPWMAARAAICLFDAWRAARTGPTRGHEQQQASHVHAPAPSAVAKRRAGHQQHREAQGVAVHRPLPVARGPKRRGPTGSCSGRVETTSASSATIGEASDGRRKTTLVVRLAGRSPSSTSASRITWALAVIADQDAAHAQVSKMALGWDDGSEVVAQGWPGGLDRAEARRQCSGASWR